MITIHAVRINSIQSLRAFLKRSTLPLPVTALRDEHTDRLYIITGGVHLHEVVNPYSGEPVTVNFLDFFICDYEGRDHLPFSSVFRRGEDEPPALCDLAGLPYDCRPVSNRSWDRAMLEATIGLAVGERGGSTP